MKKNTTTKQPLEANYVQWFMNKLVEERIILSNKYYPESHRNDLEDEEILEIYLAENNIQPTPDSKEGLHTQGEWEIHSTDLLEHKAEIHPVNDPDGLTVIADVYKPEDAELIVKAVNFYNKLPRLAPDTEVPLPNDEYFLKAVNERQALLDSHKELLDALKLCQYQLQTWAESDSWDTEDEAAYQKAETAINNAKNIKQ